MRRRHRQPYPSFLDYDIPRMDEEEVKETIRQRYPDMEPVRPGRIIATGFWGKAWCDNVGKYKDYGRCFPSGRSYVRRGEVVDLYILKGAVHAIVCDSHPLPYKVDVYVDPLPQDKRERIRTESQGKVDSLPALMRGELPESFLKLLRDPEDGIFPTEEEIRVRCHCPGPRLCKHVVAVLYGIGRRLDEQPELFFTLRGIEAQELFQIGAADAPARNAPPDFPAGTDFSAIFGIHLESPQDAQLPDLN